MNAVAEKPQPLVSPPESSPQPGGQVLLILLICIILAVFAAWEYADFLEVDPSGEVQISAQREMQLKKRLKRLNHAEQYVLIAEFNGWYPCYHCGTSDSIYLLAGEVWRYGVTMRGEKGRYGLSLKDKQLAYIVQFRGSVQDCLVQEAIKIYTYPKLPENLKRATPLIRPPGNKVDL